MDEERTRLDAAYRATTYRVAAPGGPLDLRVGTPEPALEALLDALGVRSWAFVSAANPRSRPAAPADNERAHAALLARVRAQGWQALEGVGLPAAGWAPERSLFIAGITRAQALELGRQFGQNAILWGASGGPAELAWLT
jgi:hypothetical protein